MPRNFTENFYGPKDIQMGRRRPTRARLGPKARPGGLCPPRWPPAPPLCSINTPIFQNPRGVDEIFIQPSQSPEPLDPI